MQVKAIKELYSARDIAEQVTALAEKLNADYAGQDVLMLCVLKGAFMFFSDLLKHIEFSPQIDFIRLSSYGERDVSSGQVSIRAEGDCKLDGRNAIVVEDIVDSGRTLDFLQKRLLAQGVKTLRIAALIDKRERREVDVAVDYACFTMSSGFVVGYGLDYAEHFRELPALYTAELEA